MASQQTFGAIIQRESVIFDGPQEEQKEFLQSLVTNDVAAATADTLIYAALLTPQGKYLSDFFVRLDAKDNFVLDVVPSQAEALVKRLAMYKLRRPIRITREPLTVAVIWGEDIPKSGLIDPRDPKLGWRVYDDAETIIASVESSDYDFHRLKLAIPESETDLIPNDTYILEAGFEKMNGVDFKKGCYVGQEIVARMKHKTELRKGYVLVSVSGTTQPGEQILTSEKKPVGTLHSTKNGVGLAFIRFDKVKNLKLFNASGGTINIIK